MDDRAAWSCNGSALARLRCARATSRPSRCRICLGGPAQGDEEHTLAYPLLMVNARVEAKKKQQGETLE